MNEFNVPYNGPPAWLAAEAERSLDASPTYTRVGFVRECMGWLVGAGLDPRKAANVTANSVLESGWGAQCYWYNGGGWKITRAYAYAHSARTGHEPAWYKSRGHEASGDPPWCFYRVFDNLTQYLSLWMERFVPVPGTPSPGPYAKTGERFWAGDERWFGELILVGYKGTPSQLRMRALRVLGVGDAAHPSVKGHRRLVEEVLTLWAQLQLKLDPDGAWGPKIRAACSRYQAAKNLPVTGELDGPTVAALAAP
jgi:hypothetical protein